MDPAKSKIDQNQFGRGQTVKGAPKYYTETVYMMTNEPKIPTPQQTQDVAQTWNNLKDLKLGAMMDTDPMHESGNATPIQSPKAQAQQR